MDYTARPAGGGDDEKSPREDRAEHAERLRAEYRAAWQAARARAAQEGRAEPSRVVIDIAATAGETLQLQSLESPTRGTRLLAVREVAGRPYATVAVEHRRSDAFANKLDDYADVSKDNASGLPRNHDLFAPIESIVPATLASRWTDTLDPPTQGAAPERWELWTIVERGEDAASAAAVVRALASVADVELSPSYLTFLDRVVFHARATVGQLEAAAELLERVAEVRLAKPRPEFVWELPTTERRRVGRELVERVALPAPDAPHVCLLDTGVNRGHPLLEHLLSPADLHTVHPAWGKQDNDHHGTGMAGLALYGDLSTWVTTPGAVVLTHRLESSKIFRADMPAPADSHGAIMTQGIARPELAAPTRRRVFCLAVTTPEGRDRGLPSSWSAELDQRCWERPDDVRRLFFVSAGNSRPAIAAEYPSGNLSDGIHDPGQAWNALTVGAFTDRDQVTEPELAGWVPLAPSGGLAPRSTTSTPWAPQWPLKPELALEGGNLAASPAGALLAPDSLRLLTTHFQHLVEPFDTFGDTSAATALAARMAAQLVARYPALWPETVRALMVHSARWTAAMWAQFPGTSPAEHVARIRACGYGVPDLARAATSAADALTLVVEQSLTPFEGDATKDMHLHALPWPVAALEALGEVDVTLRVTLSYFVEVNPARRGYSGKHPYPSHHLAFDVLGENESVAQFRRRLNYRENPDNTGPRVTRGWQLGEKVRRAGSVHTDWWVGLAADLARRTHVAVYPTHGWWRKHRAPDGAPREARYALVVSIETPPQATDLYTPVAAMAAAVRPLSVANVVTT